MNATHIYTGTLTVDGEPSPFTGLPCIIVRDYGGIDEMGFDVLVQVFCTAQELADRYMAADRAAGRSRHFTADEMASYHTEDYLPDYAPGLYFHPNKKDDLTAITR